MVKENSTHCNTGYEAKKSDQCIEITCGKTDDHAERASKECQSTDHDEGCNYESQSRG